MNPRPHLYGVEIQNTGCGRLAMETLERAFWQSRMTTAGQRAEPPQLTNLPELAREIRRTYTTTGEDNHD